MFVKMINKNLTSEENVKLFYGNTKTVNSICS